MNGIDEKTTLLGGDIWKEICNFADKRDIYDEIYSC